MSQVSIASLEIENFGPFFGQHTFDFEALDGKTAILIGGRNGAGKTHLLRALYLAAAGESGKGDLRKLDSGSETTRFLIDQSLNRRARLEGADTARLVITITQNDATESSTRRLKLTREIKYRSNSPAYFRSFAQLSGQTGEITDASRIEKLRDAFLPRHLARFFFFDAERSQSMQLDEQEIVEGISRVLGLWTYKELEEDLRNLATTKIPRSYGSGSEAERKLNELNADIQKFEGNVKFSQQEQEDIKGRLTDLEEGLTEVDNELKTIGAVDPRRIEEARDRKDKLTKSTSELEASLAKVWEAALPIALLGDLRKELTEYLSSEERKRDHEGRKKSVEPRIPVVRSEVFDGSPIEHQLSEVTLAFYVERLELALKRIFEPPPSGMSARVFVTERTDISAQIRGRLQATSAELRTLAINVADLDQQQAELRELNSRLVQLQQDREALARGETLREKRGQLTSQIESQQKRRDEVTAQITIDNGRITELRREEKLRSEEVRKIQKGRTLVNLAHRYRDVASEIRSRAAVELRERISDLVGELWVEIAERGLEYTGLRFNDRWECSLVRRNGSTIGWDEANTSAGQKQVRLLAFTEALRRLAQLAPPLVVDTPMGRLDQEVRRAVLERLYLGGHQSIILTTNSEIDPASETFDRIRNRLARVYTLHPEGRSDGEDYAVRVSGDYFGRSV